MNIHLFAWLASVVFVASLIHWISVGWLPKKRIKYKVYTLERTNSENGLREYICAENSLIWTINASDALMLARRKDADDLATICDDADHVGEYEVI